MSSQRLLLCFSVVLLIICSGSYGFAEGRIRITRSGSWVIATSENFSIRSRNDDLPLKELAEHCETLRLRLQGIWMGPEAASVWTPRCVVILHPSIQSYSRTLGHGVGRSVGCASLKIDSGRVVERRIDLRLDSESWKIDALPHELTHVVLAERFADYRIPPWLDEGIGVLSESRGKQQQRMEACERTREAGRQFKLQELLKLKRFPSVRQRDAFYGQSAALVQMLQTRGEHPSHVLAFAEHAVRYGYESAFRKFYKIDGWQELTLVAERYRFEPRGLHDESKETLAETDPRPAEVIVD